MGITNRAPPARSSVSLPTCAIASRAPRAASPTGRIGRAARPIVGRARGEQPLRAEHLVELQVVVVVHRRAVRFTLSGVRRRFFVGGYGPSLPTDDADISGAQTSFFMGNAGHFIREFACALAANERTRACIAA